MQCFFQKNVINSLTLHEPVSLGDRYLVAYPLNLIWSAEYLRYGSGINVYGSDGSRETMV